MTKNTEPPVFNNEIAERITVARIALLMQMPFWGNLVSRLRVYQEDAKWCPTACTDGRAMYYNPKFVAPLTDKQLIFLLCHEVLHVVFEHLGRANDLSHEKFLGNIAADFAVNQVIVAENIGSPIGQYISFNDLMNYDKNNPKEGTLYDMRFKGWSYEEIYEFLKKNKDELKEKLGAHEFSVHLDLVDGDDDGDDGDGKDSGPKLTAEELQEIKDMMREAVLNAAQAAAGNVPLGIKRLIANLVEPKMNWQEMLTQKIDSQVKSDYSYMKLGRRSFSSDFIFPSMKKQPKIKVFLALDTSGSIGPEEINIFFSEVSGIVQQFPSFEIHVICFDSLAHNYKVFTEDTVNDLFEYVPEGGGGTVVSSVYNFFKEKEIVPEQLVFFTDGEVFDDWGDPDYCDTLFIIKNHREIEASHGESVMYS